MPPADQSACRWPAVGQIEGGAVQADQTVATIKAAGQAGCGKRPGNAPVQLGQGSHTKARWRLGDRGLGCKRKRITTPAQPARALKQAT
jgi:hypothetical protein